MKSTLFLFPLAILPAAFLPLAAEPGAEAEPVSFRKDVKPILRDKCVHCHNRKTLPGRVSFESAKWAFGKTPEGKPFFVPGKPEESAVIQALTAPIFHEKAMPMVGPRPTKEDIEILRRWVKEGARWPKGPAGIIRPTFIPKE